MRGFCTCKNDRVPSLRHKGLFVIQITLDILGSFSSFLLGCIFGNERQNDTTKEKTKNRTYYYWYHFIIFSFFLFFIFILHMAELVSEDGRVDIIQQWYAGNKDIEGFSLTYQSFSDSTFAAYFTDNHTYFSNLYCPSAGQFTHYSAYDDRIELAQPDIDGDVKLNVILDLSDDGTRWEGTIKGSTPFGYGQLYDSMNRLIYEGYLVDRTKVLWGKTFHADLGTVEYEGGFCNNERMGHGVLNDRQGAVIYDGTWLYGHKMKETNLKVTPKNPFLSLHNQLEQITLSNKTALPTDTILIINFPRLKIFRVGSSNVWSYDDDADFGDGELYIIHCPCLEQVIFGNHACYNIKKFVCRGCFEGVC